MWSVGGESTKWLQRASGGMWLSVWVKERQAPLLAVTTAGSSHRWRGVELPGGLDAAREGAQQLPDHGDPAVRGREAQDDLAAQASEARTDQ